MKEFEWDIVTFPTFKEAPNTGSQLYPMYIGPTKLSKHPDVAMEVLKYIVSDEFQTGLARKGWMSGLEIEAVQKQYAQDTPFPDKNWRSLFVNRPAANVFAPAYDPQLVSLYQQVAFQLVTGSADMNTAFRTAEEQAQQIINEANMK